MFISQRFCDVISRSLHTNWDYILRNGNNYKNTHKPIMSVIYNDIIIEIMSSLNHKDYCIGENCNCLVLTYTLSISQNDGILLDCITFNDTSEMNNVISEISALNGKTYTICMCGADTTFMDNLCKTCYIYQYRRPDEEGGDCCICLSNIGSWVKLPCDHYVHTHCCYRMVVKKCPLCRAHFNTHDIIKNPYDL